MAVGSHEEEVVYIVPTITTVQTHFDYVPVGSEFATIETRLYQDGYYNPETGQFRKYFIEGEGGDYIRTDLEWEGMPGSEEGLPFGFSDYFAQVLEDLVGFEAFLEPNLNSHADLLLEAYNESIYFDFGIVGGVCLIIPKNPLELDS